MTDSLERPRKLEFVEKARHDRAANKRELQKSVEGSPQGFGQVGIDP